MTLWAEAVGSGGQQEGLLTFYSIFVLFDFSATPNLTKDTDEISKAVKNQRKTLPLKKHLHIFFQITEESNQKHFNRSLYKTLLKN